MGTGVHEELTVAAEQFDKYIPQIVGLRGPEGTIQRLGLALCGGEVVFEPDCPYDIDQQRLLACYMLGQRYEAKYLYENIDNTQPIDRVLQAVNGRPGALLHYSVSAPDPVMRITKLARSPQREFAADRRRVADLLPLGLTSTEMSRNLGMSKRSIDGHIRHIANNLGLPPLAPREQVAAALVVSNQVDLPETAFADSCSLPGEKLGPQIIKCKDSQGVEYVGIRLLGGELLLEPNHPRPLSPIMQDIVLLSFFSLNQRAMAERMGISKRLLALHMERLKRRLKITHQSNVVLGLLRADPPYAHIQTLIGEEVFSASQISIGRSRGQGNSLRQTANEQQFIERRVFSELYRSLPYGLHGMAQLMLGLALAGELDDLLGEPAKRQIALLRHATARPSRDGESFSTALMASERPALPEAALADESKQTGEKFDPHIVERLGPEGKAYKGVQLGSGLVFFEPHPGQLSARQQDVVLLAMIGRTDGEIARHLGISEDTVGTHLAHVRAQIGADSRSNLLLGLLRGDPPFMRIHQIIEPGVIQFSSRQLQLGPLVAMNYNREEMCKETGLSLYEVRGSLEKLPNGLLGWEQFVLALTLSGYLDHTLPPRLRRELALLRHAEK